LQSLVTRGLGGLQLITSDDHAEVESGSDRHLWRVPWQRCQSTYSRTRAPTFPARKCARSRRRPAHCFNAPDRHTADAYLAKIIQKYTQTVPTLAAWLEKNVPEGLTVFSFPASHRRRLRTANGLERLSREISAVLGW